jgi:hypothetical protein
MHLGTEAANPTESNLPIAAAAPVRIATDRLSSPDGTQCRRFANRAELLKGPIERRIQYFETEIDFGIGRSQWRGNAHYPIGCTGAHDVGAQSEVQSLIGDGIGERACRVRLPGSVALTGVGWSYAPVSVIRPGGQTAC